MRLSYDAIKPGTGACVPENHGTGVASLIAGHSRLHGTAPGASILRVRAFTFTEEENEVAATTREIALALKWAVDSGARVGEFELYRTGRSAHRAPDRRRLPQRAGPRRGGGQCRPGLRTALSRRVPGSDRGDRNERQTGNLQRRQQGQAHFRFRPRRRCARRACAERLRDRVRHLVRRRKSQRHRGGAYRDASRRCARRNQSGAADDRDQRSRDRTGTKRASASSMREPPPPLWRHPSASRSPLCHCEGFSPRQPSNASSADRFGWRWRRRRGIRDANQVSSAVLPAIARKGGSSGPPRSAFELRKIALTRRGPVIPLRPARLARFCA